MKQFIFPIILSAITAIIAWCATYALSNKTLAEAYNDENRKIYRECTEKVSKETERESVYVEKLMQSKLLVKCLEKNMKDDEVAKTNSWTYTGGIAPVPERLNLNLSQNVSHQSTIWYHPQGSSGSRTQVQSTRKTQWIQLETPGKSGSKVSRTPEVNSSGSTREKGTIKNVCPEKIILRNAWNDPRVQYAYTISCWDMDFIKTIEAESRWDVNASWDSHKAFWLCQINKLYNAKMQKDYKALSTDNEKVKFCHDQYKNWVKRWVIKTRLYGYNVRNLPRNKNIFTFKQ